VAWDETGKEKLMIFARTIAKEDRAFQKKTRNWLEANLPKHKARRISVCTSTMIGSDSPRAVIWARIGRRDDGGMSLTPLQEVI